MPVSPITIANFFFSEYGYKPHVVIQKLVYLAHGWYMALEGKQLVDEQPQAWTYGPLFPSLYSAIKRNQSKNTERNSIFLNAQDKTSLDERERSFLRAIHARYGDLYAGQLTALTHRNGSPWHQMVRQYLNEERDIPEGIIISNDLIRADFLDLSRSR